MTETELTVIDPDPEGPMVCLTHLRFVPCRSGREAETPCEVHTSDPEAVKIIAGFQRRHISVSTARLRIRALNLYPEPNYRSLLATSQLMYRASQAGYEKRLARFHNANVDLQRALDKRIRQNKRLRWERDAAKAVLQLLVPAEEYNDFLAFIKRGPEDAS